MNRESNIDFSLYTITEDGSIFSKTKNKYLSNKNAHPYVTNEYVTKNGVGDSFQRHRVIWFYFNGEIPKGMQIDHISGDKSDNRLENLRCVSPFENTHNENTYNKFLEAVKTDEHRKKLSNAAKGRKMTDERYKKCEPTMFKKGHLTSQEIRDKISNKNSKPVLQIDVNGNIVKEWKSASEAGKTLNINSASINKCCNGGELDKKRNKWTNITQYKGFKWKFKTDYDEMLASQ